MARFIPDCLILFRRLLADPRINHWRKLLLGALLVYLAFPLDLVPDFIPVAGQLDDVILVALVLRTILRGAGEDIVRARHLIVPVIAKYGLPQGGECAHG